MPDLTPEEREAMRADKREWTLQGFVSDLEATGELKTLVSPHGVLADREIITVVPKARALAAEQRMRELEAKLAQAEQSHVERMAPAIEAMGEANELGRRLRASLERYGHHEDGCPAAAGLHAPSPQRCTCGYHAALAAVPEGPGERPTDSQGRPLCFVCRRPQSDHEGGVECQGPGEPSEAPHLNYYEFDLEDEEARAFGIGVREGWRAALREQQEDQRPDWGMAGRGGMRFSHPSGSRRASSEHAVAYQGDDAMSGQLLPAGSVSYTPRQVMSEGYRVEHGVPVDARVWWVPRVGWMVDGRVLPL